MMDETECPGGWLRVASRNLPERRPSRGKGLARRLEVCRGWGLGRAAWNPHGKSPTCQGCFFKDQRRLLVALRPAQGAPASRRDKSLDNPQADSSAWV